VLPKKYIILNRFIRITHRPHNKCSSRKIYGRSWSSEIFFFARFLCQVERNTSCNESNPYLIANRLKHGNTTGPLINRWFINLMDDALKRNHPKTINNKYFRPYNLLCANKGNGGGRREICFLAPSIYSVGNISAARILIIVRNHISLLTNNN